MSSMSIWIVTATANSYQLKERQVNIKRTDYLLVLKDKGIGNRTGVLLSWQLYSHLAASYSINRV